MKILHFILGKAAKDRANGVNHVIAGLAKYCARLGAEVRLIGKAGSVAYEGEVVTRDGFAVEAYSGWNAPLRHALDEGIAWADIVHLHGVFSPWNLLVARRCTAIGRPYVVTLHDGLAPARSLARGRTKKAVFHAAMQRRHLERAAAIHVLTEEECSDLISVSQPRRIFCIPNGVDLEDYPASVVRRPEWGELARIGYLGRLSIEKNLETLCAAFANVNRHGQMRLELAGPSSAYGDNLLARYAPHGVVGIGPVYGGQKAEFIRSLDLFVHPSLSDAFSIAAMEVLALGTPLLITRTSKASYFYDRNAFLMCEPTRIGIEAGLARALEQREELRALAANGRRLIEDRLNWAPAAEEMLAAYSRVLKL